MYARPLSERRSSETLSLLDKTHEMHTRRNSEGYLKQDKNTLLQNYYLGDLCKPQTFPRKQDPAHKALCCVLGSALAIYLSGDSSSRVICCSVTRRLHVFTYPIFARILGKKTERRLSTYFPLKYEDFSYTSVRCTGGTNLSCLPAIM